MRSMRANFKNESEISRRSRSYMSSRDLLIDSWFSRRFVSSSNDQRESVGAEDGVMIAIWRYPEYCQPWLPLIAPASSPHPLRHLHLSTHAISRSFTPTSPPAAETLQKKREEPNCRAVLKYYSEAILEVYCSLLNRFSDLATSGLYALVFIYSKTQYKIVESFLKAKYCLNPLSNCLCRWMRTYSHFDSIMEQNSDNDDSVNVCLRIQFELNTSESRWNDEGVVYRSQNMISFNAGYSLNWVISSTIAAGTQQLIRFGEWRMEVRCAVLSFSMQPSSSL